MTDFNQTADALDRMAVQQQAIVDAAAEFRKLGSIDASTKALEEQNRASMVMLTNTNRALSVAEGKLQEAERQAGVVRELAEANAARTIADAEEKAQGILAEAKVAAELAAANGAAEAAKYAEDTKKEWAVTREHLENARTEIEASRKEKFEIEKSVSAAQNKLDEINTKLRSMLEGK